MEEVRGLVKALTKAEAPEAIADVLRALAKAPVTVPILHELKCGAVVSKLRKHENESVSTEAKLLIKQWKGLAAAAGVPQTNVFWGLVLVPSFEAHRPRPRGPSTA